MTNEEQKDNTPLILGIGLAGLGALVLLSGAGGKPIRITASSSVCNGDQAQVHLGWTSSAVEPHTNNPETEFDIIIDDVTGPTVRAKSWTSDLIPQAQQGKTHKYQVAGVKSKVVSDPVNIVTATCGVAGQPNVTNMSGSFV